MAVGDSTRLEIIFDTRNYKSKMSKSPRIQTNEGQGEKRVRISAFIMQRPDSTYPLVVRPYKLDISQFGEKVRNKMKFNITNVSGQDILLKLVSWPEELFKLKLPRKIDAGEVAEAELELTETALDRQFEKSFTVETNDSERSRFTIPVKRARRFQSERPAEEGSASSK